MDRRTWRLGGIRWWHWALGLGVLLFTGLLAMGWQPGSRTAVDWGAAGAPPSWLTAQPKEVQYLYRWAAANRETLQYIPCYCGCENAGQGAHQSNADCYFAVEGGRWEYQRHGSG